MTSLIKFISQKYLQIFKTSVFTRGYSEEGGNNLISWTNSKQTIFKRLETLYKPFSLFSLKQTLWEPSRGPGLGQIEMTSLRPVFL